MPELGKAEELKLSSVFAGEASEFTPWLSNNLSNLASKLGFELQPEDTEVRIGSFRLDISAKTSDGRVVVIENQFGRTDPTHLGQLLTYAGGLNAKVIIWIAEHIRDEHRAAIDWLNNNADDADFFAVEARAVKIDDSLPALFWDIVASPNTWTRAGGGIKPNTDLGPGPMLKKEYWTSLNSMIEEQDIKLTRFKPDGNNWQGSSIGNSDFFLNTTINSQDEWIRVEIYLGGPNSREWFERLEEKKSEIENKLGFELNWDPLEGKQSCRINIVIDADPTDRDDWTRQHEWIIEKRQEFEAAFRPLVKSVTS